MASVTMYWPIGALAKKLNVPRTTLAAAVRRRDVPSKALADGTLVVLESDVQWWLDNPSHQGKQRTWTKS